MLSKTAVFSEYFYANRDTGFVLFSSPTTASYFSRKFLQCRATENEGLSKGQFVRQKSTLHKQSLHRDLIRRAVRRA
jgi:hypothetical protein